MKPYHTLILTLTAMGLFAVSCSSTQKGAATGAAAGAALGTIIADGDNHKKGALLGAGLGAAAGAAVGKSRERNTTTSPYYY